MKTIVSLGGLSFKKTPKVERPYKGKSIIRDLSDYTLIDLETTGLNPSSESIIELSAIRVRSGKIVDTFSSLVNPEYKIDEFISELTGITNDMLKDAPLISSVLPQFLDFVSNDIIVGHNVNFDINFLYDFAVWLKLSPFSNDFIDTMRMARKLLPELPNHKLCTMAEIFEIDQPSAHRALADCKTTYAVYKELIDIAHNDGIEVSTLEKRKWFRASMVHATVDHFDENSPFLGKICVFTGALSRMPREDAMQIVVNMGGACRDSVTSKTNYLIMGNYDYNAVDSEKSSKHKRAEELILNGKDISIISENVFYEMISSFQPEE